MFSLRNFVPAAIAALALFGSASSTVQAATFNLNINGQSPQALIDAMNVANSNGEADTINLSGYVNFTASNNATYGPTGFPVITNDGPLTINGIGFGTFIGRVNVTSNPKVRIFAIGPGANLTINNLRFANGSAGAGLGGSPQSPANRGGAIYNGNGGSVTLNGCNFDYNTAVAGSAIFNGNGATLRINGGDFGYNTADADGGAILNESGDVTVANAIFNGNQAIGGTNVAGNGGAICNSSLSSNAGTNAGTLAISNCDFGSVNNNRARQGGAVATLEGSTTSVDKSIVRGNSASFGAGLMNEGFLTITNSFIARNTSNVEGGGVYNRVFDGIISRVPTTGRLEIRNSTIADNDANNPGSGVRNLGGLAILESCTLTQNSQFRRNVSALSNNTAPSTRTVVSNTIVAGNGGGDVTYSATNPDRQNIESGGYNLIGTGNAASSFNAAGDRTGIADPKVGSLSNNVGATPAFPLQSDSPAIDQGNSALATDQTGVARPIDIATVANAAGGNGSDIGATEYDQPQATSDTQGLVVNTLSDRDDGTCGISHCSLREAINAANSNGRSPSIEFDAAVFGASRQTITLGGTQLPAINTGLNLQIAAPPVGLIVDGAGRSKVFTVSSLATLRGLTIRGGNAADDFERTGGGVFVDGNATLINCTLTGNSSPFDGGAIAVDSTGTLLLIQSTLTGNSARAGTAVSNFRGRATIANCTLVGDNAVTSTDNTSSSGSQTRTTISNSLVVGQNAVGANGANSTSSYQSGGYNIITGGTPASLAKFDATGDRTDLAPSAVKLGALAQNGGATQTVALLPGSPAIDGGDPALTAQTAPGGPFDQRGTGFPRIVGGRIDIGAFEAGDSQPTPPRVEVSLSPNAPQTNDVLTATAVGVSPTNGSLSYSYQWSRNGNLISGENEPTLQLSKPGNGDKNDVISVTVRATDSQGTSAPATAQVTVVNSPPQAISSQGEVPADTEKGFVLRFFDPDGDAVTYKRVGGPRNGVTADIRVDPTDGVTKLFYKSRPFYGGVDIIRFVVFDSDNKQSNESTLGIRVLYTPPPPANRAPIAGDTFIDTYVGDSVVKGLLGSDPDGDAITFRIVSNARFGSSEIKRDTDGQFRLFYTSLNRFFGNDRVIYIVTDSRGKESNLATVGINFINRSPVAKGNKIGVASGQEVSQFLFADDPDNDAVTFRLVNNPRFGRGEVKLDAQGKWRFFYQSLPGYVGPDQITFIAIDPFGKESQVAAIDINVVRVTSSPGASSASVASGAPSSGGS